MRRWQGRIALQRAPWAKIGLHLATGSGKTKVMSLLIAWAHLHWVQETDVARSLGMSNTHLLIAPNLIVLERLLDDFQNGKIFRSDPILPPEFRRQWMLKVCTAQDAPEEWNEYDAYLVVTNIHKLFGMGEAQTLEASATGTLSMDFTLDLEERSPTQMDLGSPSLLRFLRTAQSQVIVFNDEAHHVHDEAVHYGNKLERDDATGDAIAWNRVLTAIHQNGGLALQCDLSATLFEESNKTWFRHTVYDFPLEAAIRGGIVKQPYLAKVKVHYKALDGEDGAPLGDSIPLIDEAAATPFQRYGKLIQAGIANYLEEQRKLTDAGLKRKALLFIVCNTQIEAKQIAEQLEVWKPANSEETPLAGKIIEIHIGKKEQTDEKSWQKIRDDIKRVDSDDSPYSVIVSVMMLKEGWDVKNIKVIVPLRPCDSRQLTEQLLGRGLRRMFMPAWNAEGERQDSGIKEGLYVIEHPSFQRVIDGIRDIMEDEPSTSQPPVGVLARMVEPPEERAKRDLPISRIVGAFAQGEDWPERIGNNSLPPLPNRFKYDTELKEIEGKITHHSAIVGETQSGDAILFDITIEDYASLDAALTQAYCIPICREQRLSHTYLAAVKRIVKTYLERCTFDIRGFPFNIDAAMDSDEETRAIVARNICNSNVVATVKQTIAKVIGEARGGQETPDVEIDTVSAANDLREFETTLTKNHIENPRKSVHALCCFDSPDEMRLAQLLDDAEDVASWLWNDQRGVGFRIQYVYEGRTPYYYPDFLVRLTDGRMFIVESKGSQRTRDVVKAQRSERYAEILTKNTETPWSYLLLVNDRAARREDIKWWSGQGRLLFADLVAHAENASLGGPLLGY